MCACFLFRILSTIPRRFFSGAEVCLSLIVLIYIFLLFAAAAETLLGSVCNASIRFIMFGCGLVRLPFTPWCLVLVAGAKRSSRDLCVGFLHTSGHVSGRRFHRMKDERSRCNTTCAGTLALIHWDRELLSSHFHHDPRWIHHKYRKYCRWLIVIWGRWR